MKLWILIISLFMGATAAAELNPETAFQQGKDMANSYKDISKQKQVIDSGPTTVPNYGSQRKEEKLYGTAGLTGPASAHMADCAANPTQDGAVHNHMECEGVNFLAKRPAQQAKTAFPNIENDPAAISGAYVSGNLESIARNLGINQGGVATQCKTVTVTDPPQYVDRVCIEGYEVHGEHCTYGREVVIDADTNYQCDKTLASKKVFDCSKKWICDVSADGCDPGGIKSNSIEATLRYDWRPAGGGDYYMEIGNVQDNIYGEGFHEATAYFDVVDPAMINKFILEWLGYDDYIWVKLNDQTVHVGPDEGGDRLELCKRCHREYYEYYDDYGDLVTGYEEYCTDGATEDGVHCRELERYGPHEVAKNGIIKNIDVRHLLRKGRNKIWMRLAVGGLGDMATRWRTRQFCPPNCRWVDQCANMIK